MKKVTMATMKSFIKKNRGNLFLNVKSRFSGLIDGCESVSDGFVAGCDDSGFCSNTLGVCGLWLVGSSRDYFSKYEDSEFIGIEYSNSCGRGIVAIKK
ncbi:hypothetical protein EOM81_10880 [bacterium]|nr:hypothetical protein [bacterium]